MSNQNLKASLYYKEGSSDKCYHAEVAAVEGGYLVNFRYGRRGAALTCGCKTQAPVGLEQATKIYLKLIAEKKAKGYTPDVSGATYQGTDKAAYKTDFIPQLLNPITEAEAFELIKDESWAAQEKHDGERRAVHTADGLSTGMNRKGLSVLLPQAVADELKELETVHGGKRPGN